MDLQDLCSRLDSLLAVEDYAAVDPSTNGLQVGPETMDIDRVAVTVDAATATIDEATTVNADLLVAHHGIIWNGLDSVTGRAYEHVSRLLENDMALYACHLPLDGHQELGNAAQIAAMLALDDRAPFGDFDGVPVGQSGRLPTPMTVGELASTVQDVLPAGNFEPTVLPFGPDSVESVAIVTGSGADMLTEATAADMDVLVTGEGKQAVYHEARERGINVILAGHYATETTGVQALAEQIEEWGTTTTFLDHPTGL